MTLGAPSAHQGGQRCEREPNVEREALRTRDAYPIRAPRELLDQARLADAGLPLDHQQRGGARQGGARCAFEVVELGVASDERELRERRRRGPAPPFPRGRGLAPGDPVVQRDRLLLRVDPELVFELPGGHAPQIVAMDMFLDRLAEHTADMVTPAR